MNSFARYLLVATLGAGAGAALVMLWPTPPSAVDETAEARPAEPLYWVAPMDPDYRRDGPGKSPMGMDLVPVYADDSAAASAGLVSIAPEVVNNLGVRTAEVGWRPLEADITTVGYVQYNEDMLIHIHPRLEGWLEKLHVKAAGDPVEQGQPLYELYSPQLVTAQEEYLLALQRNNSVLLQAAEGRLRALQLSPGFIEQLRRERQVRQRVTFYAPQSGVVDNLAVREGFFVRPDTKLMSIGALDDVWVEAEVFERMAELVAVDQPVAMRLDSLPGRTWRGRVDYIYPSLDPSTRTLRVRLRFPNRKRMLMPNMFARITIFTGGEERILAVPREALIRTGQQDRVVMALGDGRFKSVAVEAGRSGGDYREILSGLEAGDEVVVSAQFLLDSESSRSSDFRRMQPMQSMGEHHHD